MDRYNQKQRIQVYRKTLSEVLSLLCQLDLTARIKVALRILFKRY